MQNQLNKLTDLSVTSLNNTSIQNSKNILNSYGKKCFSQNDEDGITLEILRRLNMLDVSGNYLELGVGNGLENNSLILAALGWNGVWIGNEELCFDPLAVNNFSYINGWVTAETVVEMINNGLVIAKIPKIDVVSVDLDGNDIYIAEKIISTYSEIKVCIVEYNSKFPPPIKFQIGYDPKFAWSGDDYFGASLSSYVEMFNNYGYTLVACNSFTGSNAFFVKNNFMHLFNDIPRNINDIYIGPQYNLPPSTMIFQQSPNTIKRIFKLI